MGIEIILKIAGIGLLTAVVNNILKKSDKEEIATLTTLAGLVLVLLLVMNLISGLFESMKSLFNLY